MEYSASTSTAGVNALSSLCMIFLWHGHGLACGVLFFLFTVTAISLSCCQLWTCFQLNRPYYALEAKLQSFLCDVNR